MKLNLVVAIIVLYKPALENDEISIKPAYKTLPIKYRFSINNKIGAYPLARFKLTSITINDIYWYNWEYYAYKCPIWKKRFDNCCIIINHDKKEIIFKDDEEYEQFGEDFYYETDEQSKKTQENVIRDIPKI